MTRSRISGNDELAMLVASRQHGLIAGAAQDSERLTPCLLVRMGERWCALLAESVREVVSVDAVTPLPAQLPHILGVMLVHGRIVPVFDMARLVNEPEMALTAPPGRRLVVIARGDVELGLVADDAKGVIDLPVSVAGESRIVRDGFIIEQIEWDDRLVSFLDEERLIAAVLGTEQA